MSTSPSTHADYAPYPWPYARLDLALRAGDRTLDLDIIVHGDTRLETSELTLPHPRAHERDFVLRPWFEVRPDAVLPGHGAIAELLARVTAAGEARP